MEPNKNSNNEVDEKFPLLAKPFSTEELAWTIRTVLDAEVGL